MPLLDYNYELESEAYWRQVDWVLEEPSLRAGPYVRPMVEVRKQRLCEQGDVRDEDCTCLIG